MKTTGARWTSTVRPRVHAHGTSEYASDCIMSASTGPAAKAYARRALLSRESEDIRTQVHEHVQRDPDRHDEEPVQRVVPRVAEEMGGNLFRREQRRQPDCVA